jgi:hypothetical protein
MYYKWNSKMEDLTGKNGYEYGLIAQQVQKEFPEMVTLEEDGYLSIDYIQMIPVLVQCIKELKSEVDELKQNK